MKILDDRRLPNSVIKVDLVESKAGKDGRYRLTKKRGYNHRYQITVTFTCNVSQFDEDGIQMIQDKVTEAIKEAFSDKEDSK